MAAASEADSRQMTAAYMAYAEAMTQAGVMVGGSRLRPTSTATTIRSPGGKTQVLDGPYAETKEHFGGFSVVDVPDDEQARYWAAKIAVGCGWPMQVQQLGTPPDIS